MKVFCLALLLSLTSAFACENGGFLPANKLRIPVTFKSAGGMTKVEFDQVIDKMKTEFEQEAIQNGYRFRIVRLWTSEQVNAQASSDGELTFFGGLARYPGITKDAFALVNCHEIGHLIGGAPKFKGSKLSAEAQADYFATLKCLRRLFAHDNNAAIVARARVPAKLAALCKSAHPAREDNAICVRSGLAALSVGTLFANELVSLGAVSIDKTDPLKVTQTLHDYPATNQCRLDTMIQGALCEVTHQESVSQRDEVKGTCHPSLGHKVGTRPACWYKFKT